jgi:WD40 repeat protein
MHVLGSANAQMNPLSMSTSQPSQPTGTVQSGSACGYQPGLRVTALPDDPDGKLLATAGVDHTVRPSNPATHRAVGAPLLASTGPRGDGVFGVAFSPDGKLLATADADGTVQTWHMPLFANPYAALCADVGPPTKADWTHYAPGEPQPSICR